MDYIPSSDKHPMWHWMILYLVIGLLIFAGIYFAFLKNLGGNSPASTAGKNSPIRTSTITYGTNGFEPKSITISLGQTVTWTNQAGIDANVSSSPHPAHTDYPPLNLGAITIGQSKSLMFPVPGVYKYHNHLNPSQYGSITIE